MMTLIDTLAKYPVQTIEINGQLQAYREAGQGQCRRFGRQHWRPYGDVAVLAAHHAGH